MSRYNKIKRKNVNTYGRVGECSLQVRTPRQGKEGRGLYGY